jgi:hypothetical protein
MVSTQRGRLPQFWFMKSSISSAVVFGSTVTGLSSGGGGAFTLAHSSTMLAAGVETAPLLTAATVIPIAANVRDKLNFTLSSYF